MYRITFTAGTEYDSHGVPLKLSSVVNGTDAIRNFLTYRYGGFTEEDTHGGWLKDNQPVIEKGKRWSVITSEAGDARIASMTIAQALHQEAVALEVERLQEAAIVSANAA